MIGTTARTTAGIRRSFWTAANLFSIEKKKAGKGERRGEGGVSEEHMGSGGSRAPWTYASSACRVAKKASETETERKRINHQETWSAPRS